MVIYELIDLSIWKTQKKILKELRSKGYKISFKQLDIEIKLNNRLYIDHLTNKFIAKSVKGYIATQDYKIIKDSLVKEDENGRN